MTYKEIYQGGQGEIVEKKSRFIATVKPVKTEEEAVNFINETKKKYWDAKHNCSAFVLGKNQELNRCNDDGEPAQTAGRPMLDVLLKEGVTNVAVVVTRYFGGVLLGTGGLVRAYQKATKEGLLASQIIEVISGKQIDIHTDYNGLGKLQYLFAQNKITVMDTIYEADVNIKILVPIEEVDAVTKSIISTTNGTAKIVENDDVSYALRDKEIIFQL